MSARFWSRCSVSLAIVRDKFTGMEVNIEGDHKFFPGDGMLSYLICKNGTVLSDCKGVVSQIAYDNELRFHITDEGLSISQNVCWETTRVSGKPFFIEPLANAINIDQRIHEKSNRSFAGSEGARENIPFIPTSNLKNALFFEVEIFVNVVAPCVNSTESRKVEGPQQRTSLMKKPPYNRKNCYDYFDFYLKRKFGPVRESNPGSLAPKARIIPLDQQAKPHRRNFWTTVLICYLDSAGVITPVLRCLVVNSPAPLITVFSASRQWSNSDSSLRRDIQCGDFIEDASDSHMT